MYGWDFPELSSLESVHRIFQIGNMETVGWQDEICNGSTGYVRSRRSENRVKSSVGLTDTNPVGVGLHQ